MSKAAEELERIAALLCIPAREVPRNEYERGIIEAYHQIAKALTERASMLRLAEGESEAVH